LIKCSALLYLLGCLNDAELDFGKRIHRYLATIRHLTRST